MESATVSKLVLVLYLERERHNGDFKLRQLYVHLKRWGNWLFSWSLQKPQRESYNVIGIA